MIFFLFILAYSMTSSRDVAVYAEYSYDDVMLRPLIALEKKFLIPAPPNPSSVQQRNQLNFISMTSASDNTNIVLRIPAQMTLSSVGPFTKSTKGEFHVFNLKKFQTVLVSSSSSFLSGVRIESNADLLVLTGKMVSPRKGREKILSIKELPAAESYGKEYFVFAPIWLKHGVSVYVSGKKDFSHL